MPCTSRVSASRCASNLAACSLLLVEPLHSYRADGLLPMDGFVSRPQVLDVHLIWISRAAKCSCCGATTSLGVYADLPSSWEGQQGILNAQKCNLSGHGSDNAKYSGGEVQMKALKVDPPISKIQCCSHQSHSCTPFTFMETTTGRLLVCSHLHPWPFVLCPATQISVKSGTLFTCSTTLAEKGGLQNCRTCACKMYPSSSTSSGL